MQLSAAACRSIRVFVIVTYPLAERPFKAFGKLIDARSFARIQVASEAEYCRLYEVPAANDARQAIGALKMGEATFLEHFVPQVKGRPHGEQAAPEPKKKGNVVYINMTEQEFRDLAGF